VLSCNVVAVETYIIVNLLATTGGRFMINRIRLKNFICFGPDSEEVDIRDMNVIIGRNGSGKSSFIQAIDLLKTAPSKEKFSEKLRTMKADEWIFDRQENVSAVLEFLLENKDIGSKKNFSELKYTITFVVENQELRILEEKLIGIGTDFDYEFFYSDDDKTRLNGELIEAKKTSSLQSFLSIYKGVPEYPVIDSLATNLEKIKIYRKVLFSFDTFNSQMDDSQDEYINENFSNLPLVLNRFEKLGLKSLILDKLQFFYEETKDLSVKVEKGIPKVFIREKNLTGQFSRLSDGVLHYLCLLCILLHPDPPPVICIEDRKSVV
jgi:predicted ATPase